MGINAIVGQSGGPTCVINSSLAGVWSRTPSTGPVSRMVAIAMALTATASFPRRVARLAVVPLPMRLGTEARVSSGA